LRKSAQGSVLQQTENKQLKFEAWHQPGKFPAQQKNFMVKIWSEIKNFAQL
jgi:hypothetical protein